MSKTINVKWVPFATPNQIEEYADDFDPSIILNYDMFENKIDYAEEKMTSDDFREKKTALDNLVDALEYYISIMNGGNEEKKRSSAALSINRNQDSKVYSAVKEEIDEIMKLANEYFDIRHNKYIGSTKRNEKREPLVEASFVGYLCDRVHALLVLLKNCSCNANMIV